ncbi:MAG: hypothetical protein WCE51_05335 [Chthoniobacterales bacterium]
MNTESDFDHGDKTALVCVDDQTCQKMIVSQLTDLGYTVHLGLFEEDVLLKLATYSYHVVVVYENFKGGSAQENPILREMMKRSGSLRRENFVVLISHRSATNDAMTAFIQSVDQIVNVSDLPNFKPVLRRGVAQHSELYLAFHDGVKATQAR